MITIAIQVVLYPRPFLHSVYQLLDAWVFLQSFPPVLGQALVVTDLIQDHVRVCELGPDDEWSALRQAVVRQLSVYAFQESDLVGRLVLRVTFLRTMEECFDEEGTPFS